MTMTTCRKCGSEVARKEKKCPYCDVKKPGDRWWHPLAALAVLIVVLGVIPKACSYVPEAPNDTSSNYKNTSLKQWRSLDKDERSKIIESYLSQAGLSLSASTDFYKCISQHSYTKNDDIKASEALDWCKQDYQKDPSSLAKMVDFDVFRSNVRLFDSSYQPLIAAIKDDMNDPSSFKHLETKYRFILDGAAPYAIATTTYQGANSYGTTVKNQLSAKIDLKTGHIVEYLR